MKTIRLIKLSISSFKGCRSLELDFAGRSASIYGRNAAGKSTIYDAFTWLLFGRDSGGAAAFEIKPRDVDGAIRDHAAVTAVEAELDAGSGPLTLRRTFSEKWTVRRGSSESSFDGNISEYFVDGVPVKKYEYERRVAGLIGEDLFRMLTDVFWFCGRLDWRERRKALFEVCCVATDAELLAGAPEFAGLAEAAGRLDLDSFKKKLLADRKAMSGTRNTIPARLDECQKTVTDLSAVDFSAIRAEREARAGELEQLRGELLKLGHGALLDSRRNDLERARNSLEAYRVENERHRASQAVPVEDKRPAMKAAMERAGQDEAHARSLVLKEDAMITGCEQRIEACRGRWRAENGRIFEATVCPTCGQKMPEAAQASARAAFQAEVERRKREAVEAADREKETLQAARERRERYAGDAERAGAERVRLENELAAYVPPAAPEVQDLPHFAERLEKLRAKVREQEEAVASMENETAAIRTEAERKAGELRAEVERLGRELAKESMLSYAMERTEALRKEAREAGARLEELDRLLQLCEDFTRYKTRRIEEDVNSRFRLVRWKLFEEQVNGGINDCCEATAGGVPYRDLNHGAKVNAGLDVIQALSRFHGVTAPLFLDGAESVTELLPVEAQVIRLVVSANDKELRCEYGT